MLFKNRSIREHSWQGVNFQDSGDLLQLMKDKKINRRGEIENKKRYQDTTWDKMKGLWKQKGEFSMCHCHEKSSTSWSFSNKIPS